MKTERELFQEWHFEDWRKGNETSSDAFMQKEIYSRVYSHEHTRRVRNLEFKAWQAATQREGFKFVPVEPTLKMSVAYEKNSIAPVSSLSVSGYKAMIGVCDD